MPTRLANLLRAKRAHAKLSREALARLAGISRQSYGPIEDGQATPSTEVALRLAKALGTTVEDLFHLPEEPQPVVEADWVGSPIAHSVRVRLCHVGGRLLARPIERVPRGLARADGIATPGRRGRVRVSLLHEAEPHPTVIALGCDPAVSLIADELERRRGVELVWTETGSRAALEGLARGEAHVAGCHLLDEASGTFNRTWVERLVPFACELVGFAVWEQGLIVAPGNPHKLDSVADLARPGLRFINREPGSGSRALLDSLLQALAVPGAAITGYDRHLLGHLAVAEAVASGLVDVGIGVRAAAVAYDLGFLPLGEERYDLVVPRHFIDLPGVEAFLDHLRRPSIRAQVEALGGYDVTPMGTPA